MKKTTLKTWLRAIKHIMYYINYSPKPFRIQIDVTDRCNFQCPTCSKWKTNNGQELNTSEWTYVLKKLKGATLLNRMTFSGGEPFLRDDLLEFIAYAKKHNYYVNVITNGSLLNEHILKELDHIGLDNLVISLNGVKESTHDRSRDTNGNYHHIIDIVSHSRLYRMKINIETIIMKTNVDELVDLTELVKKHGLHGISYQVLADVKVHYAFTNTQMEEIPTTWFKDNTYWIEDTSKISDVLHQLIKRQKEGYPILNSTDQIRHMLLYYNHPHNVRKMKCLSGVSTFNIDPYGDVRLCYGYEPVGNVMKNDPIEIWRSDKSMRMRQKMKRCNYMCSLLNNNY